MINIKKDISLADKNFSFGVAEVIFPPKDKWNETAFRTLADSEINALKEKYTDYDRKAVWGENPYVRFFKKFKKTFPVMLQFESVVLKDRPFPAFNAVSEVAFLLEITQGVLSGAHDADCIDGDVALYLATEKEDFEGIRETLHTYPNDFCARDNSGIIFSLIAGTDRRTSAKPDSTKVLYPVFAAPDMDTAIIENAFETLKKYVLTLAPDAQVKTYIL